MTTSRDDREEERTRAGPAARAPHEGGEGPAHDATQMNGAGSLNGAKHLNGSASLDSAAILNAKSLNSSSLNGSENLNGAAHLNGSASLNGAQGLNGAEAVNGSKCLNGTERLNGTHAANIVIEEWARRYGEPLRRFFVRRGTSAAEAEDLTQEVYVRITRMDGVDSIREPEAFLFQTAANLLKDNARRSQARRTRDHVSVDDSQLAAGTAGPDRVLEGKQSLEGVLNVLKALTARQRAVFILHRFDGMTYAQIAEHLGVSTSAVEKHMMKAISRLHQHLEER